MLHNFNDSPSLQRDSPFASNIMVFKTYIANTGHRPYRIKYFMSQLLHMYMILISYSMFILHHKCKMNLVFRIMYELGVLQSHDYLCTS